MENLTKNTSEENMNGLIIALAIAFQDAKISDVVNKASIKIHVATINNEQFANLYTILELYKKQISLKRSAAKICIEITDLKEVEK